MSHETEIEPRPETTSRWRGILVLGFLAAVQFMLIVDITVVQVALPSIGAELALEPSSLTWVVTAYTITLGGLMILGGRLADLLGSRWTLLGGIILFTLASLLCGASADSATLIAGRVGQGIGAALASPAALSIIAINYQGAQRRRALGIWAAIGAAGAAAGVMLGGLLTDGPGWRWVFFVNVPVGVLAVLALGALLTRSPSSQPGEKQTLDVAGALLITISTAALIFAVTRSSDAGWGSWQTLAPVVIAVAGYLTLFAVERRAQHPLLKLETLARRPVLAGVILMLVGTGLLLGLFFLASFYLQHTLRWTPLQTGLLFLPVAVAIAVGAQIGAHLLARVGGKLVAVAGFAMTALGAALMVGVNPDESAVWSILPGFLVAAVGLGPIFVTATSIALASVRPDEAGVASGIVNTFHELGGSIGIAVVSAVAAPAISGSSVAAFSTAYLVCAAIAGVAAIIAALVVPAGTVGAVVGHGHG